MYSEITSNKRRTVFLMIIFIIIILGIGYVYGKFSGYGYESLIPAAFISLGITAISYFQGDKIALLTAGAKQITEEQNPRLYHTIENLCITSGNPMPKIYIIPDQAINAFATGRDPKHSSIAVTAGAITKLENEELEGVLAHELSHIKNYDIRLMMVVIVLVGMISLLANWFMRARIFGSRRSNDNDGGTSGIFMIIGLVLMILSPIIAQLIQLAVSRRREYLADASSALLTRYPEGLARALQKIANDKPLARANQATAHLYIANPFGSAKKTLNSLFSTHPPIADRIAKLRAMA